MKVSPDDINSFPESEAIDLASAVVQLLDSVEQLKVAIEERDERIAKLERIIDIYINPSPTVVDLNHPYNELDTKAAKTKVELSKEFGSRIASLEEDFGALEAKANKLLVHGVNHAPSKKTEDRKAKLATILMNRKNAPIRFAEVGKLLELGSRSASCKTNTRKQNMYLFGQHLEQDRKMFVVDRCPTGGKQVCLTKEYYHHLIHKAEGR